MTLEEAKKAFGSGRQVCLILGIAVTNWTRWAREDVIPLKHQIRLTELNPELRVMDSVTYYSKVQARKEAKVNIPHERL